MVLSENLIVLFNSVIITKFRSVKMIELRDILTGLTPKWEIST